MANPTPGSLLGAATVFVVQDVLRSVEHYCDVLGFHTEFTYGQPTFYAGVERDGVLIHLQAASETKRQPGHGAVNVFVTDVDALYQELKSRGARTLHEPKDYPYGMRDVTSTSMTSMVTSYASEWNRNSSKAVNRTAPGKAAEQSLSRIVSTLFMLLLAFAAATDIHAAAVRPLRIAFLFTSGTMASMWMAKETGGFAKEGLDVEMISMSSALALPALLANEVDVIQVSAVPVLTASLRGFDVVFIAGMLNTMIWDLYARSEIKNAEQLRGKIVGTERPGSPVAYGTLIALRKLGLAAKDVQLRPFGGTIQIAAALQAGQVVAGAAAPPVSFQIERAGFRSITSTLDQPYQNVGLVIRRGRMDELAPRLVPLLRSVRAGIDRYNNDKAFTLKVIPKYTRDSDPDVIDRTYEFYRKAGFRRDLIISEPGIRGILDFLSETVPEAKKAAPGQFFDDRFVRQLNSIK